MIDKNTLDLAREWRKDIDRGAENFSQDYIDAAAEVIQALPEVIVDGDKVREVMAEMAYSLEQTVADDEDRAHDVATARWRDRLEDLLPAPLVEIKLGAWAMHPEHGHLTEQDQA